MVSPTRIIAMNKHLKKMIPFNLKINWNKKNPQRSKCQLSSRKIKAEITSTVKRLKRRKRNIEIMNTIEISSLKKHPKWKNPSAMSISTLDYSHP